MQLHAICIPGVCTCLVMLCQHNEQSIAYLTLTCTAKHTKENFHNCDASKALQMKGWAQ